MASRSVDFELNLNDKEAAKLWIMAFMAKSRAKKWQDNDDEREITENFISCCGMKALACVVNILSPQKVEDLPFLEIKKKVDEFLEPTKKLVVAERAQFYARRQMIGENVSQFVVALRKAAENCEFEKLKDVIDPSQEMIKMGLIAGLRDLDVKQKVLEKFQSAELSISEIVEIVQQLEHVRQFMSASSNVVSSSNGVDNEVNYVDKRKTGNKMKPYVCFRCGKEGHMSNECRNKVKCFKCNKFGHVSKFCNKSSANCVAEMNVMDNDEECFSIGGKEHEDHNVICVKFLIERKEVKFYMQKDTGAACTLISDKMWIKIGKIKKV